MANREKNGHFSPGNGLGFKKGSDPRRSNGLPKYWHEMRKEMAECWPKAMENLREDLKSEDLYLRREATRMVIEYNLGKPNQPITVEEEVTVDALHERLREVALEAGVDPDADPTGETH